MPRRKNTLSLKQICTNSITGNIDALCEDYVKNYFGKHNFLHIIGPFEELTSHQIKEIISVLVEKRSISKPHLHLLLHSRVESLDLSGCNRLINDEIIIIIATRCQRIKYLNVAQCNRVTQKAFQYLAHSLTQAVSLNFAATKCYGDALLTVIDKCTKLKELNLHGVSVEDDVIFHMCRKSQRGQGCCGLVWLDIFNTMVSGDAVIALINHMPNIRHINWINVFSVFEEGLEQEGIRKEGCDIGLAADTKCQLQSLIADSSFPKVTDKSVYLACIQCLAVSKFVLAGPSGFTYSGLQHVTLLENLQDFTVSGHHENVLFGEHIAPILSKVGQNLKILNLQDIDDIDLYAVGYLCQDLSKLTIDVRPIDDAHFKETSDFQEKLELQNNKPFSNLCQLVLYAKEEDITPHAMSFLLRHSLRLQTIDIIHIQSFSDSVLLDVFNSNRFLNLKKLYVYGCNKLSREPVYRLLHDQENVIEKITLLECREISRKDSDKIKRMIKRENFDTVFEWS
ncbi:F-box and leucine-rich repeat protein 13-like [Ptychodera flava]|uniref:F-box and leucine-rich repeat protein 13-like n=1 Tax=Ptychodera flava TaxID=63121 RepID=UPI00396A8B2C